MCIDWSEIIANYQDMLCDRLSDPPAELLSCSLPNCSAHASLLDDYSEHIMSTMLHCASYCFPCKRLSFKRVPDWEDSAGQLRRASIFWHRVWEETSCPSSGVLYTMKRQAKKGINLKYAVLNGDANILFVIGLPIPSQRERKIIFGWMLKVSINLMLLVFLLLMMVLMVIPTLLMPLHPSLVLC